MRKSYEKIRYKGRHRERHRVIMSVSNRTGQLCNGKLMRHKRVFQWDLWRGVCLRMRAI